jgi:hypothetical protein
LGNLGQLAELVFYYSPKELCPLWWCQVFKVLRQIKGRSKHKKTMVTAQIFTPKTGTV